MTLTLKTKKQHLLGSFAIQQFANSLTAAEEETICKK
jgi:hypothetical protein